MLIEALSASACHGGMMPDDVFIHIITIPGYKEIEESILSNIQESRNREQIYIQYQNCWNNPSIPIIIEYFKN